MAEVVDDRKAIKLALDYVKEVYSPAPLEDFKLEEVEKTDSQWKVTVSFRDKDNDFNAMVGLMGGIKRYKEVTIDKSTGTVVSMKIRAI